MHLEEPGICYQSHYQANPALTSMLNQVWPFGGSHLWESGLWVSPVKADLGKPFTVLLLSLTGGSCPLQPASPTDQCFPSLPLCHAMLFCWSMLSSSKRPTRANLSGSNTIFSHSYFRESWTSDYLLSFLFFFGSHNSVLYYRTEVNQLLDLMCWRCK